VQISIQDPRPEVNDRIAGIEKLREEGRGGAHVRELATR